MGEYDGLDQFTLKNHGDHWEQEWSPLIQAAFPAYEVFWRRYIVPLTNRIDPKISHSNPLWIRPRPGVSDALESMTMSHYSVFYYLARARGLMSANGEPFPEDVFALLDTCRDNVQSFFESILGVFRDFGLSGPKLPAQDNLLCIESDRTKPNSDRGGFVRAKQYRDVVIHNPVLGRMSDTTGVMLPHWTALERIKVSWQAAETLEPKDWINSHELYEALYRDITLFLQHEWQVIIDAMEELRYKPQHAAKFKTYWALDGLVPNMVLVRLQPLLAAPVASYVVPVIGPRTTASYSHNVVNPVMLEGGMPEQPISPKPKEISSAESNEET